MHFIILFIIEEVEDGSYRANAVGQAVHTEADNLNELHQEIRDAVHCHFDERAGSAVDSPASRAGGVVDPVRIPRDLTGADLATWLAEFDDTITRQSGSHMRLTRIDGDQEQHLTIPTHKPLRVGTLR